MTKTGKPARRAWKILKWSVLGITGLFLSLVVFLMVWIDPNDYRDDITALVKEQTGLVLAINGNIGWNFYPALGFSVEGLSLATAEGEKPLASVGKVVVSVELLPLFSKQVQVRTLYVDQATANLVVDAYGKANWDALTAAGGETPPAEPAAGEPASGMPLAISVPKIVITNTVVEYEDQTVNFYVIAKVQELVVEDVSLDKEFPLHLVASISTNTNIDIDFDLRTFIALDLDAQKYGLHSLDFKAAIAGILGKPFNIALGIDVDADMTAQKINVGHLALQADGVSLPGMQSFGATLAGPATADLAADTAMVGPLTFDALGVKGTLTMNLRELTKDLAYNGTLDVQPFNAKNLMRTLGMPAPATTDPLAMTKIALKTGIDGTLTRTMLDKLDITIDGSHLRGSAGIADVATTALVFDLALDSLDADRYLPPAGRAVAAEAPPSEASTATGKPEPLLPVDTLRSLNIDGKFTAGKIIVTQLPMTNITATVKAKNGDIRLDPLSAGVLEGTLRGSVQVDARGNAPRILSTLVLDRVEVGGLVKRFAGKDLFLGKISLNLDADTTGNDIDTLMKKAIGSLDMNFADATLKGMNLTNELNGALTQQLGAFSMLVPDYQKKLPKEMAQDTVFSKLAAKAKLKDGVAEVPSLNAEVKDGAVKGAGKFNIVTMDFDYSVAMTSAQLADNKYFAGSEFPVHCKGNINGSPASWCKPDSKAIGDMLKKAAGKAATDRVKTELASKLGVDVGSGTGDAKETVKKEAEKKAKEEVNKQLEKALQKFF